MPHQRGKRRRWMLIKGLLWGLCLACRCPHLADEETEAQEGLEMQLMSPDRKSRAKTSSQGPLGTVPEKERGVGLTHGVTRTRSQRHREDREAQKSRVWERIRQGDGSDGDQVRWWRSRQKKQGL